MTIASKRLQLFDEYQRLAMEIERKIRVSRPMDPALPS